MRIIVLSDTHIPERAEALPEEVTEAVEGADMVLHAGDFTTERALAMVRAHPNFIGVAGNMDGPAIRRQLRELEIIELEGVRVALTHGWGAPPSLPQRLRRQLDGEAADVIVFGHSHQALNEELEGVLLFNPGSPTDSVFAPYRSYGVLEVEDGRVRGTIVKIQQARKP